MIRTATTTVLAGAALAFAAGPAAAAPPSQAAAPAQANAAESAPGPKASPSSKAKAYGKRCQGVSKKKAEGQSKSPFALCVTALARAQKQGEDDAEESGEAASFVTRKKAARAACKAVPKTKAAGQKKTQFAICVTNAAKLRREAAEMAAPTA